MSAVDHEQIWVLLEQGETLRDIGNAIGRSLTTVRTFVLRSGGRRPPEPTVWSEKRMCLADREEISRGLALGESFRAIAARIGRAPSTISREVKVNGGRDAYRAAEAEATVRERVKRPRKRRLERDQRLRKAVEKRLEEFWSPTQISKELVLQYPDRPEMRISPEAIYEALYQGVLTQKPRACLRTKRTRRVPKHRRKATGPGVIKNRLMIKERPAHIEDRLEVGHWEGDLIVGNRSTALATLVERMTRFTLLVQLPGKRTMDALNSSLEAAFAELERGLTRSLTWDQGKEIAGHTALAEATGLAVYLCDRSSPWQRGTNENTNGLLRQWWPRSTNFYALDSAEIMRVQKSLNNRPRQTLNWHTPAQAMELAL